MVLDRSCPLCYSREVSSFYMGKKASAFREFFHCDNCDLVFSGREFYPGSRIEKERYLTHNNNLEDSGYRAFLKPVFNGLRPLLKEGSRGLDFGCGPASVLVDMFEKNGFFVEKYDPLFFPGEAALEQQYDFILCTETAEHFHQPRVEFERLNDLLRSGGILALKTAMLDDWADFPGWYYHTDITHVVFYSKKTFRWLAVLFNLSLEFLKNDVILFRKDQRVFK